MTVNQFYKLPVGACVHSTIFGTGVVMQREMLDTIVMDDTGHTLTTIIEDGVYRIEQPGEPVLCVTVQLKTRDLVIAETNKRLISSMEYAKPDIGERFLTGKVSSQISMF
ncbi:MAG: hypothetical protein ACI3XE_02040 [Eubacteriales bacterium]